MVRSGRQKTRRFTLIRIDPSGDEEVNGALMDSRWACRSPGSITRPSAWLRQKRRWLAAAREILHFINPVSFSLPSWRPNRFGDTVTVRFPGRRMAADRSKYSPMTAPYRSVASSLSSSSDRPPIRACGRPLWGFVHSRGIVDTNFHRVGVSSHVGFDLVMGWYIENRPRAAELPRTRDDRVTAPTVSRNGVRV